MGSLSIYSAQQSKVSKAFVEKRIDRQADNGVFGMIKMCPVVKSYAAIRSKYNNMLIYLSPTLSAIINIWNGLTIVEPKQWKRFINTFKSTKLFHYIIIPFVDQINICKSNNFMHVIRIESNPWVVTYVLFSEFFELLLCLNRIVSDFDLIYTQLMPSSNKLVAIIIIGAFDHRRHCWWA